MFLIYCGSEPFHEAELIYSPKSTKSCTLKAARLPSIISLRFALRLTQVSRSFREVLCCELAGIHCHIQAEFLEQKTFWIFLWLFGRFQTTHKKRHETP